MSKWTLEKKLIAQQKREETFLKKYGVRNPRQLKSVIEKAKGTNKERYGGTGFQSEKLKEKTIQQIKHKYGVENIMKIEEIKEKFRGENNPMKNPEIAKRASESLKGKSSKLKNKTYEEIHGKEKAKKLIQEKSQYFKSKFLPNLDKLMEYLEVELIDQEYLGAHIKHNWKCKKCGNIFSHIWNALQQGYLCPICYPRKQPYSKGEKEIVEELKKFNLKIIENDRSIIYPKELDIFIPEKNVAIEFNGVYFHSESFNNNPKYHLEKTNLCKEKGIRLVHIFEDEWIYKREIVLERVKNILQISKATKLHARNCSIQEIDSSIKNQFLEQFHIQGQDNSTVKLGAFFQNNLVAVMTFSYGNPAKGSRQKENVWELNRFCSDYNYNIRGIAGKLLEYFKRNYQWKEIFSYADRRWSNGSMYEQLGFKSDNKIRLNYWYVDPSTYKRIHRFALRKKVDEPKDIPEYVLRSKDGFSRIWDCGNIKYTLKRD